MTGVSIEDQSAGFGRPRRKQGGNMGAGLPRGAAARIGKKEKRVTALVEGMNRKAARALARKVVKDAQAMAAAGTITKAEAKGLS